MFGMTRCWRRWGWKLGLASWLVVGGAIGEAVSQTFASNCAFAQITPDKTLPNNSSVRTQDNIRIIEGGTKAGSNLFHSFQEFSVPTGGTAFFNNALDIQNIISRVTGKSISNIDGLIKTKGTANLFLINPNGIIFGPNAQLNIGGSFLATTASAIGFGEQGFFSASNPQSSSSLLSVNPSALLFNQIKTASIQNNSVAPSGLYPSSEFIATGLRVPDGKSLLLVGGDINMNGGGLYAFGGRVELGGLAGAGTVKLNRNGNNLSLSFPNNVERSNVALNDGALVDVAAGDGGSIAVNAGNFKMTGRSILATGIRSGLGSNNSKAGDIDINATGTINLNGSSIFNQVQKEASGQGGDVNISASTLQLEGGAQVNLNTYGSGKGGNLSVDAQNVQLVGTRADGKPSGLFVSTSDSTGDAGDLTIKTNNLLVKDGAVVDTTTTGSGKGGNLRVDASNVQLVGTRADGQSSSGLFVSTLYSTGDAGDLTIKTNNLLVKDGAGLTSATFGAGKAGNLKVDAQDVQVIGSGSGIDASSLNSTGDAGDLTIKTNTLLVKDGARVFAGAIDSGKGGNLKVEAQDVQVIGGYSLLASGALSSSAGNGGDLTIKTNTLLVKDGATVYAGTFGSGKAGNLKVDAQDVQVIGSGSSLSTFAVSTGDAGDLTIKTNNLSVKDGAVLTTGTFDLGKAGNLRVDAQDVQVIGSGSGLFASTQPSSKGDAGDLTIKTNTLLVRDGAIVSVQGLGTGTAGNMTLNARSIRLNNNALLTANTRSAKADPNREQATININSQNLIMSRNSNIRTNAAGKYVIGGNINIDTDFLIGFENSDISANSANFRGGNVRINAQGIFGTQFRDVASDKTSDITATGASPDLSGTVEINSPDVDPSRAFVNLPTVPVDTKVAQGCYAGGAQAQSEFIITGRGGLPPNPGEALSTDAVQVDLVTLNPEVDGRSTRAVSTSRTSSAPLPIVEATGWVVDFDGKVVLTANAPTTPHSSWETPTKCSAPKPSS